MYRYNYRPMAIGRRCFVHGPRTISAYGRSHFCLRIARRVRMFVDGLVPGHSIFVFRRPGAKILVETDRITFVNSHPVETYVNVYIFLTA